MRSFDIYGVGSALVDTEVSVTDQFLEDHGIQKGLMTIMDHNAITDLLSLISNHETPLIRKCGGSACNSLVAASSFGSKVFFSYKVANDHDGRIFISDLKNSGVSSPHITSTKGSTGKCLVMITPDAERTMCTFLGVNEDFGNSEINKEALVQSDWLYIEGYQLVNDLQFNLVRRLVSFARKESVKVALSLSDPGIVKTFSQKFKELMSEKIDLVFCNALEAQAFTETNSIFDAARSLRDFSHNFIITNGSQGSTSYDGKNLNSFSGIKVDAVNTNGAGDMYAGAFLYAVCAGRKHEWSARFANYCASKVVEKFGPRLESRDYEQIKRKFNL